MIAAPVPDLAGLGPADLSAFFRNGFLPGDGEGPLPRNGKSRAAQNGKSSPSSDEKAQPPADATTSPPEPDAAAKPVTVTYLREATVTAFFFTAAQNVFGDLIKPQVVQTFIDEMKRECKATNDPIEAWLVEHAALMRFVGAFLHGATIANKRPQDQAAVNAAACQTSAEMRRMILALRDYRTNSGLTRSKREEDDNVSREEASCKKSKRPCKKAPRRRKANVNA